MSLRRAAYVAICLLYLCSEHQAAQLAQAIYVPTRCMCNKFHEKAIPYHFIKDFQVVEKGAHCHRHEIILTVRLQSDLRKTCLDVSKGQGKHLLDCWQRHLKAPMKQGDCIKRRRQHRTRLNQ